MNWREALTDAAIRVLEELHDGDGGRAFLAPAPDFDPDREEGEPWGIAPRLVDGLVAMGLVSTRSFVAHELKPIPKKKAWAAATPEAEAAAATPIRLVKGEVLVFTVIELTPLGALAAAGQGVPPASVTGAPPQIGGLSVEEGAALLDSWATAREASLPCGARAPRAKAAAARLERDLGQQVLDL